MEFLKGCQAACFQPAAHDAASGGGPGRTALCSWAEEEVTLDGLDGSSGLDYGFLGRLAQQRPARTSPMPACAGPAGPLYEPGSLVQWRRWAEDGHGRAGLGPHSAYQLDPKPLGRGSYGEVTGATHRRTGARRAVKTVGKAELRRYVQDVDGFVRREVDILRRLDHPNIVRLYEAYEDESSISLVLELCEGGDLLERVTVARERLPEREAAQLLNQMLGAVQHLFLRGIVHRDLKPENFLFTKREPEREPLPPEVAPVKLIDFGLSRRMNFEAGMRLTPKIGTTEYMAPEAFAGQVRPQLADRMDIWSVGVLLHVIFIGHFPSPRLGEMSTEEYLAMPCWGRVSPWGRDLLGQLLRRDPARRPNVTSALRHPWLQMAPNNDVLQLARRVPGALRGLGGSVDLRRLALVVAAREVDDCDVHCVRRLFRELELECQGGLTRAALDRAASSATVMPPIAAAAGALCASFDVADLDSSGAIEWSEFLAVVLGASGSADGSPEERRSGASPPLREATCWRAFDSLGYGGEAVNVASLAQLLAPNEAQELASASSSFSGGPSGGTGGSFDPEAAPRALRSQRALRIHQMLHEVDSGGTVIRSQFLSLLRGT